MTGYTEWLISLKTFVTECLLKVQTSFESKCPAGKWYVDGWTKLQKRERENTIHL